jgi:BTB/POZ domain-containing protein KCTD9
MKNPIQSIRDYWNKNITKPLFASIVVFIIALIGIIIFDWIKQPWTGQSFWDNIDSEIHGVFLDIVVVILIYNFINSLTEKKQRIKRYLEELEDYRPWQNEEATWRIRGLIRRLNLEGMTNPMLIGAYLRRADLMGANLQGANLHRANLKGADFRWAKLKGAYLREANLEEARLMDVDLELFQLKYAHLSDDSDILISPTIMMDGTKYDESWAERINQAYEAHESESGTPSR